MEQTKFRKAQSLILRIGLVLIFAWLVMSVVQHEIDNGKAESTNDELRAQIAAQERVNEELSEKNAADDLYLEQQARNKGLAKPGEIIFKEVPGNN